MSNPVTTSSQSTPWQLSLSIDMTDDSFSRSLIALFDEKRSRLHCDMNQDQEASRMTVEAKESPQLSPQPAAQQAQQLRDTVMLQGPTAEVSGSSAKQRYRQSAGSLFRRSSAFLRTKLDALKVFSRSNDDLRVRHRKQAALPSNLAGSEAKPVTQSRTQHVDTSFFASPSSSSLAPPAKIALNTTITLPHTMTPGRRQLSPAAAAIRPIVIKEFPPQPLKYSEVEPFPDNSEYPVKRLVHRISLPVLRRVSRNAGRRRQSDAGIQRTSSVGRQARRFVQAIGSLENSVQVKGKERASKRTIPPFTNSHSSDTSSSPPPPSRTPPPP